MSHLNEIDTFVIVMFENRSFDHVLGHLRHPHHGNRPDVDGLKDPKGTNRYNNVFQNQVYKPFPMLDGPIEHDPPHSRGSIATQLDVINGQATMAGFVEAYNQRTNTILNRPPPMGFLVPGAVPTTGFLAAEYALCNRWFSALPTGTQPNRAMAFCGQSLIDNNAGAIIPNRGMVFDWLEKHGVRWRVYHSGLSYFLLFNTPHAVGPNFRNVRLLARDMLEEPADRAPQVIIIEPEYEDAPVHFGSTPNDNHPPLPMGPGEAFLRSIYTALTSNPARWAKTLLIVTYDEHGGFYDHVEPHPVKYAPPPGARFDVAFETTGVRVPALLASPWVARAGAIDDVFDHTSWLQLLAEKFAGGPDRYSDAVTRRRDQGIQSLSVALTAPSARSDLPLTPAAAIAASGDGPSSERKPTNDNQRAFSAAARASLQANRDRALERFPELALLRE